MGKTRTITDRSLAEPVMRENLQVAALVLIAQSGRFSKGAVRTIRSELAQFARSAATVAMNDHGHGQLYGGPKDFEFGLLALDLKTVMAVSGVDDLIDGEVARLRKQNPHLLHRFPDETLRDVLYRLAYLTGLIARTKLILGFRGGFTPELLQRASFGL